MGDERGRQGVKTMKETVKLRDIRRERNKKTQSKYTWGEKGRRRRRRGREEEEGSCDGVPGIPASSHVRFGGIRSNNDMEPLEALNGITGAGPT